MGDSLFGLLLAGFCLGLVFLALRGVVLWYWRINEILVLLREIRDRKPAAPDESLGLLREIRDLLKATTTAQVQPRPQAKPKPETQQLEEMSFDSLVILAEKVGAESQGHNTKGSLIQAIRNHRAAPPAPPTAEAEVQVQAEPRPQYPMEPGTSLRRLEKQQVESKKDMAPEKCGSCGLELDPDAHTCPRCRTPVAE